MSVTDLVRTREQSHCSSHPAIIHFSHMVIHNLHGVFFSTATGLEEERLLNYLASSAAHPLARPVKNVKDAVPVNLRIYLRSLDLVRLIYLSFNPKLAVNLK